MRVQVFMPFPWLFDGNYIVYMVDYLLQAGSGGHFCKISLLLGIAFSAMFLHATTLKNMMHMHSEDLSSQDQRFGLPFRTGLLAASH